MNRCSHPAVAVTCVALLLSVAVRGSAIGQCEVNLLDDPAGLNGDSFGRSVSLAQNRVLVGAPAGGPLVGAAYVFCRDGSTWTLEGILEGPPLLPTISLAGVWH